MPSSLQTTTKLADELHYHAKSEAVQLAKSLLEQADFDGMEIDVVGTSPPEPIELPLHLRDHTYSLYNPVDGERTAKPKIGSYKPANIPPARVSYAPPVSIIICKYNYACAGQLFCVTCLQAHQLSELLVITCTYICNSTGTTLHC